MKAIFKKSSKSIWACLLAVVMAVSIIVPVSVKSAKADVVKPEKIEATDKEIDEKMKEMAKNYGKSDDKEFMENENVRKYIKSGLESEKALEFLVKNAKIKK